MAHRIYAGANIAGWHRHNREQTRLAVLAAEVRLAAGRLARDTGECAHATAAIAGRVQAALTAATAGGALYGAWAI